MRDDQPPLTTRIPADVNAPDKLLCQLTARQLTILAATGLVAGSVYLATISWLPIPAIAAAVFPIIALGVVLAVARRDGMSLDAYALAALLHLRSPKTQVAASEGVPAPPVWCRVRGRLPAPITTPVRAVRADGVLELADGGTAVLVQAGTIPFGLRTHVEQAALVASFGRWLNSLDAPIQILIQARPVELTDLADQLTTLAPALPDPALEAAAHDHSAFMHELNTRCDLLSRRVLIVLRDTATDQEPAPIWKRRHTAREASAAVVVRRAEEAVRALTPLGITARLLTDAEATTVLADSLSPNQPRLPDLASPSEIITAPGVQP